MSICANLCRRIDRSIDSRLRETGRFEARRALLAAALVPGLAVGMLALAGGGYSAPTWGWTTLALVAAGVLAAVALGYPAWSRLEQLFLAALAALGAWSLLSTVWSEDPSQSVLEAQRILLYVVAGAVLLLTARRGTAHVALAGLLAALVLVCGYALSLRLFPDSLAAGGVPLSSDPEAAFKLAEPIGYANGLAALAAIGLALSSLLAARAAPTGAALAGACAPLLAATLYLTFGRGAWLALWAALVVALAVDPRRLQLITAVLVLAPAPALAVVLASQLDALTSRPASVDDVADDGRILAVAIVLLMLGAASSVLAFRRAARRLRPGRRAVTAYKVALVVLAAGLAAAALAIAGGPFDLGSRAYDAFNAPTAPREGEVGQRLLSFSGSSRSDYWSVAWDDFVDHPLLGSGAGSYQRVWLEHRPAELPVRDAHSLYLEALAELGPVGLLLLLGALATPLAAALLARHHPLVPAALAAYCCFLVHAGVDWDWELPAVTIAGLAAGVSALVASRRVDVAYPLRGLQLTALLGGACAVSILTGLALAGNVALEQSGDALDRSDSTAAKREARRAARWAPWSGEPWRLLGEAQLADGDLAAARSSFSKGLGKDDRSWELWLDLALASEGAERRRALDQAETLNPRAPEVDELRAEG
jgi:O-Antigen ligase